MPRLKSYKHAPASASVRLPNTQNMLTQWRGPKSNFIPELVVLHVREAHAFAAECERSGAPLLDPCGPRGDLYFLLKALVNNGQTSAT
jgi:hypothetical protein